MTVGLSLLVFLLIFGPVVRSPLGAVADTSIATSIMLVVWSMLKLRCINRSLALYGGIVVFLMLLAVLNSIVVSNYVDGQSVQTILRPLKAFVVFLSIYFICRYSLRNVVLANGPRQAYQKLLWIVYLSIVLQGVVIILQFAFPEFREFSYALLWHEAEIHDVNMANRMPGFAGAGGAQVSAMQGIGFLLGTHLFMSGRRLIVYLASSAILVISIILTGRTGLLIVGVAAFYYIFFSSKGTHSNIANRVTLLLVIGASAALTVVAFYYFGQHYQIDWILLRTFDTVIRFQAEGVLHDHTLAELWDMLIVPDSAAQLLLGDSLYLSNAAYSSDIGYVRLIFAYGIVGMVAHLLFYLAMAYQVSRRYVKELIGEDHAKLAVLVVLTMAVLNYKELFIFTRMSFAITVFLAMAPVWIAQLRESVLSPIYQPRFPTKDGSPTFGQPA